jgi:hypothetical protein
MRLVWDYKDNRGQDEDNETEMTLMRGFFESVPGLASN